MKLTKYNQLSHGMRVKCQIDGKQIDDARLSINRNGGIYICQNVVDGANADDKLGYNYSYKMCYKDDNHGSWNFHVTNLVSLPELTWQEVYDKLKQSDKPIKFGVDNNAQNEGGYHEIYFIVDEHSGVSSYTNQNSYKPYKNHADYIWNLSWKEDYKGKFYELENLHSEPENTTEIKKGFDPENLTFDGVEIKEGDKVETTNIYTIQDISDGVLSLVAFDPKYILKHYPAKPKLLKRPDGSLISEPEEGAEILEISTEGYLQKYTVIGEAKNYSGATADFIKVFYESKTHKIYLKQGLIFLHKDILLAKKKAQMLTKQLEIQYEIDRLNAEENDEVKQYWYFKSVEDQKGVGIEKTFENALNVRVFSKKTAETILVKYTQDELKMYLGIIT